MTSTSAAASDEEASFQPGGKVNTDYYVRGLRIPKYRSSMAQVVMVGLIAFCTVYLSPFLYTLHRIDRRLGECPQRWEEQAEEAY